MIWNGLGLRQRKDCGARADPSPLTCLATRFTCWPVLCQRSPSDAEKNAPFDGSVPKINGTLALGGPGQFWTSTMSRYQVELWSTAGRLLRVIERQT